MKKFLVSLILLTSFYVQADVAMPEVSPIVGATMSCKNSNSLLAINLKDKRVWMSSPGDKNGVEFLNVEIQPFRCMNCYNITGQIFGGNALIEVRADIKTVKANMTISDPDHLGNGPADSEKFPEMVCTPIN